MLLAIISDIHADLPSLEKALDRIVKMDCDRVVCLGDIVGYSYHYSDSLDGRDPDACCNLVKQYCQICICGNHDLHAIKKIPADHRKLGIPGNWYQLSLDEKALLSKNRYWLYDDELEHEINSESKEFLASLPESYVISTARYGILCTHFLAPDIAGVTKRSPSSQAQFRKHFRLMNKSKCHIGIAGHGHPEGYVQVSRRSYRMNYFRKGTLMKEKQVLLIPAITRNGGRNGFLIIDTEKEEFTAIPLDSN
jgi:predicted phosphodiesterase